MCELKPVISLRDPHSRFLLLVFLLFALVEHATLILRILGRVSTWVLSCFVNTIVNLGENCTFVDIRFLS